MKTLLLLLALSGPVGFQQALLTLTGASCVEELSEDEMSIVDDIPYCGGIGIDSDEVIEFE